MKFIIFFSAYLFYCISVNAQWTSDITQNTRVVTAPKNQLDQKIISDDNGGVIIVWEDQRETVSSTQRDIYAQRFNSAGIRQWGDSNGLPIAVKPNAERYFDICRDGTGGVIIVWEEYSLDFVKSHIRGQRVDNSGAKQWTDTGRAITNEGNKQLRPKLAFHTLGNYYLVYETSELISSEVELKVNKLDQNGARQWGTGNFLTAVDGNQTDVDIAASSEGGLLISWRDPRSKETEFDIYAQKVSITGSQLWGANGLPVCTERFEQNYQDIFPDNNGGAFISWSDRRDSIQIDIYAQRIRANGTIAGQNNGKQICLVPESQFRPVMCSDMKGGVIICWNDFRNGASPPFNIDIYAQRIDSLCNIKWSTNGIGVSNAVLSQNNQQIISDNNYGAIVAWDDRRAGTSTYDIYSQRIDSSGNRLWNSNDVPVSLASGNQYEPKLAAVNNGIAMVFIDTRVSINDYNLYLQKILYNGSTVVNIESSTLSASGFELHQNYPNPFNPETKIKFTLPVDEYVEIKIFDITGQEVYKLILGDMAAGSYSINFKAYDLSAGVYFYTIYAGEFTETKKMLLVK